MRMDKFTVKAQEAISNALDLTKDYNHQKIEPEHLLIALLRQKDSIVSEIIEKLGMQIFSIIH